MVRCMQVLSPLVYRLAKYVIVSNMSAPGTALYKRRASRAAFYDHVHAKVMAWLEEQPRGEPLRV